MDPIVLKNQHKQEIIFDEAAQMFESRCELLSHFCCQCCHMIGMTIRPSRNNESICTTCQASHANREDMIKNLPIWYDKKGAVQFHLPDELKCLREGEKLLIQQVAVYVPYSIYKMVRLDQEDMIVPLCKIYHLSVLFYQGFLMMFILSR